MADTKTTALTELASGAIDDLDVAPVVDVSDTTQGASGTLKKFKWSSIKATLKTYLDTLYLSLTGGTVAGGTRTTSGSTLTITETLNNAAVTFPGALVINQVHTASAAGSLMADFQSAGTSKLAVTKTGALAWESLGGNLPKFDADTRDFLSWRFYGNAIGGLEANGLSLAYGALFGWSSTAAVNGTKDLKIYRDAANTLAQRNGTDAQTYRLYGTYTDASNYRRVALAMTTAGVATLAPEGAGTGASGNVLHISGLPTSNPGPGILWNNAGTPAIGT